MNEPCKICNAENAIVSKPKTEHSIISNGQKISTSFSEYFCRFCKTNYSMTYWTTQDSTDMSSIKTDTSYEPKSTIKFGMIL